MGLKLNASDKKVLQGRAFMTGVINYRITAINPTKEEAEKLGITLRSEPEYVTQAEEGHDKLRLDIYVESTNSPSVVKSKFAIWLENIERKDQSGAKSEIINNFGDTAWTDEGGNLPDWYNNEGVRPAHPGEGTLYSFLKAWGNMDPEDECTLDTAFDKLAGGDIKELQTYLKAMPKNEVAILTAVKGDDGNFYQELWTGFFGRPSAKNAALWAKKVANPYPKIKGDYNNSLAIQEYEIQLEGADIEGSAEEEDDMPAF
jgi:hypothetical protein